MGTNVLVAEQYHAIGAPNGPVISEPGDTAEFNMPTDFMTNQIDETVGKNLKNIRMLKRVSVSKVAHWLKAEEDFVVSLERGHARLRASEMFILAERFGVRISSFFGGASRLPTAGEIPNGSQSDMKVAS